MKFEKSKIEGSFIISQEPISDNRGFFARAFCAHEFKNAGIATKFVQSNVSYNHNAKTVRGLHFQHKPYEEDKLVSCLRGSIFDVIVDLRPKSSTYLQWFGVELTEKNGKSLYIPKGCAHGYQTLTDNTMIHYQVSQFYTPKSEDSLAWNDPMLAIEWPYKEHVIISEKDSLNRSLLSKNLPNSIINKEFSL